MINVILNNYIRFGERDLPTKQFFEDLTFKNPKHVRATKYGYSTYNIVPKIKAYEKRFGMVSLPRGYLSIFKAALKENGIKYKIEDQRIVKKPIDFDFFGELRVYQEKAVKNLVKHDFGTLMAGCGSGKTTTAINMITMRKQPTLILVHTSDLQNQWADMLHKFLGIEKEDIGLIGGGKFRIKPITIGMIQTLARTKKDFSTSFGFTISDEIQHTPAETFKKVITKITSKYQLGLSATPYRQDGLTQLIQYYVGPIVHQVHEEELQKANVKMDFQVKERRTNWSFQYADNFVEMVNCMVKDFDRNKGIMIDIAQEAKKGNYCLILSDRVEHCSRLAKALKEQGFESGFLKASATKENRKEVLEKVNNGEIHILFATGQLAGEGLDIPRLNRLFLVTPIRWKGRLRQYVGRIARVFPGKVDAIVYDYVDLKVGVCLGMFYSRRSNVYNEFK